MTLARIRVAFCSVWPPCSPPRGRTAAGQAPPPGRETSAASVASYALSQQMPVDPEVLVGTLPNGLRYYVRPNAKPARRAELRLVVKAGSVLEDDDQQGLAHFVEHMQFEGTRHFPGAGHQRVPRRRSGLSIGADANAATSFDDTQYTLRVPTDVPGVLDRALLVLEDWAQGATFDPERRSSAQRGIVLVGVAACTSAPASGRRTRSAACSSRDRATRIGRRSASPTIIETRAARAADALLSRLVPPRPDGRDRRRRRRSRRRRRR